MKILAWYLIYPSQAHEGCFVEIFLILQVFVRACRKGKVVASVLLSQYNILIQEALTAYFADPVYTIVYGQFWAEQHAQYTDLISAPD